jgi:hypothetical protein
MNDRANGIQYGKDAGLLRRFQIDNGTNTAFYAAENAVEF